MIATQCVSDSSWLAQDIAIFAVGPRYALLHLRHPDPMKDSVLDGKLDVSNYLFMTAHNVTDQRACLLAFQS